MTLDKLLEKLAAIMDKLEVDGETAWMIYYQAIGMEIISRAEAPEEHHGN